MTSVNVGDTCSENVVQLVFLIMRYNYFTAQLGLPDLLLLRGKNKYFLNDA